MARLLVAEDSRTQAAEMQILLEEAGHEVQLKRDGNAALAALKETPPDILLTDMHMPGKTGLELTEFVRETLPDIPVVLVTADGNEELAVEALRKGASNYIPKRMMERELIPTIDGIAEMLNARRQRQNVIDSLTHSEATYTFGNDREFVTSLMAHLEAELKEYRYDDETGIFRTVTALKEALVNAIDHGNLELDSDLREQGDGTQFYELGRVRQTQEPYCSRKVALTCRVSPQKLTYIIQDEGPGFDPSTLPDPDDPESILRSHGRGLLLIRSFMDDVEFNESGNQITLVRNRPAPPSGPGNSNSKLHEKEQLKILVAEDSATNQLLTQAILEREGHTVALAGNGIEAVQMLAESEYDLILMDLEMPCLNGLDATKEIRETNDRNRNICIIAMTAHDSADDLQRCHDAGMNGHISKPIRIENLQTALESL